MVPLILLAAAFSCAASIDSSEEARVPPNPRGVSGTLISAAPDSIDLRQKDGTLAHVAMTKGWIAGTPRNGSLGDVAVGDFIASMNAPIAPGKGAARELRVFEAGYLPEIGTHGVPMPNTLITHGWIFGKRAAGADTELEIDYPGGCRVLVAPAATRVTIYDRHDQGFAKPGDTISIITRPDASGTYRAARIVINPAP